MKLHTKLATIGIDHATRGPRAKFARDIQMCEHIQKLLEANKDKGSFIISIGPIPRLHGLFEIRNHEDSRVLTDRQVRGTLATQNGVIRIELGQVLLYGVQGQPKLFISNIYKPHVGSWLEFGPTENRDKTNPAILRPLHEAFKFAQGGLSSAA